MSWWDDNQVTTEPVPGGRSTQPPTAPQPGAGPDTSYAAFQQQHPEDAGTFQNWRNYQAWVAQQQPVPSAGSQADLSGVPSHDLLMSLLNRPGTDPAAAVEEFKKQRPNDPLAPMWDPMRHRIELANGDFRPDASGQWGYKDSGPRGSTEGLGGGGPANFGAPPAPYSSAPYPGTPFTPAPFVAPTTGDLEASPGYRARFALGKEALESSAAARGSVLSGGFQKALNQYAQDYASNEYGNLYGQRLGAAQTNAGFGQQGFANQFGVYQGEQGRTLNDYLTNYNIGHTAQTDYWNRLQDLANRGATSVYQSRYV